MLSLSVRAVRSPIPPSVWFFPVEQHVLCCRTALLYLKKFLRNDHFPDDGLACISVLKLPPGYHEMVENRRYKIGEIVFHAVRYDPRRHEPSKPVVEVPIAPPCISAFLPDSSPRSEPLVIDLRHTDPALLPEDIRAIVPDVRLHHHD